MAEGKINNWKIIGIIFIVLTMVLGATIMFFDDNDDILYITILKADSDLAKISIDSQLADSYYDEAGYAYENREYKEVERNCRLAREYYFVESQGYKKVEAELKAKNIDDKLIVIYLESLDLLSDITINMFEACEHFESAVRYYDVYYNTDVAYDDMSYDMADGEIGMMNEKIREHDSNVDKYNNKLEEYKANLALRLQNE